MTFYKSALIFESGQHNSVNSVAVLDHHSSILKSGAIKKNKAGEGTKIQRSIVSCFFMVFLQT
jgi:hypothetical protein